jgi:putative hemolysin
MNVHRLLVHSTLLLCLLFGGFARAVTGPEVAQVLNSRYAIDTSACVGNTAPYHCSGVMVRGSQVSQGRPFWMLSPEAIGAGFERFAYLRKDIARDSSVLQNGYVFMDKFTAIGLGKPLEVSQPNLSGEVQVRNWNEQAPQSIPVEGVFYDRGWPASLFAAQRDQRDYFQATGAWLPILRLDLNDAGQRVFGFNQQDQLYFGYQVASRLNARFRDTAIACRDGRAAFYCNGVLIRGTAASPQFHAWNPSPNSVGRNGVSFSWARVDVGMVQIAGNQGLIFKESAAPTPYNATLRCIYPTNAGTSGIPNSCRTYCDALGVTTVAAYRAQGGTCAFNVTPAQVQLSIDVRNRNPAWNEIIIAAWAQNIPKQLPLEAIFVVAGTAGLKDAQFIQRDFYQQAGRTVPIVRVALNAPDANAFVYEPFDQSTL